MRIVNLKITRLFNRGTTGVCQCGRQQLCAETLLLSAARLVQGNGRESPTSTGIWQGMHERYHWCGDKRKYSSSAWSQWQVVAAESSKVDGRGGSNEGASLQEERGKFVCSNKEENERGKKPLGIPNNYVGRTSFGRGSLPRKPVVAVGISGGVDSAVAALLLKEKGYDVVGLFMRNWDVRDEAGADVACAGDRDLEDAGRVCCQLDIPLEEVDLVRRYWTNVFDPFLSGFGDGGTPNPDLLCNRHIKFGALLETALAMGADALATGHYARLRHSLHDAQCRNDVTAAWLSRLRIGEEEGKGGGGVELLKGVDPDKDQSYFLAMVDGSALHHAIFPVGGLLKTRVREIALSAGLCNADRQSSPGICFIGRRCGLKFRQELSLRVKPL